MLLCSVMLCLRDDRAVEPPKARKSLGAEVNWGVRFKSDEEAAKFLQVS
jgi:DNA repair protein REV1